jgi:hypothetical protein
MLIYAYAFAAVLTLAWIASTIFPLGDDLRAMIGQFEEAYGIKVRALFAAILLSTAIGAAIIWPLMLATVWLCRDGTKDDDEK